MTAEYQLQRRQLGWLPKVGQYVELRRAGLTLRRGTIEAVMFDHSSFWLAAEAVEPRVLVDLADHELQVWSPDADLLQSLADDHDDHIQG